MPHAGEWPDEQFETADNIAFAVDALDAARIGHGVALGRHGDLRKVVKERGIPVEVKLSHETYGLLYLLSNFFLTLGTLNVNSLKEMINDFKFTQPNLNSLSFL